MKKILITGATGFIGNFLVDEAISRGYNVYVAVRKTSNISKLKDKNVTIVELNFTDNNQLNNSFMQLPRFDYIIHNAGLTKSLKKDEYIEVNCRNTTRFIQALKQQHKSPDKFLYMSSLAAYGPGDENSTSPVLLDSIPKPVTTYGKSKLLAEKFIIEEANIPYIIIRPTAVYGPGDKDIFETIKLINKRVNFQIGTKDQNYTFIYVKDLVRVVLDATESDSLNKAYFVSDGNLYHNREMGIIVSYLINKSVVHISVPLCIVRIIASVVEFISRFTRKAPALNVEKIPELSARNWNCDIQPLKTDFNFSAVYNLENGLAETVNWYKQEGWIK